jgi:hypothetical protein
MGKKSLSEWRLSWRFYELKHIIVFYCGYAPDISRHDSLNGILKECNKLNLIDKQ